MKTEIPVLESGTCALRLNKAAKGSREMGSSWPTDGQELCSLGVR